MSALHFVMPHLLWALPLALLPLIGHGLNQFSFPGLEDWPHDKFGNLFKWLLRACAGLTIATLVVAAAGPYMEGGSTERYGEGAEIVIVLDRSGSMSESMANTVGLQTLPGNKTPEGFVSKISEARKTLETFMRKREADTFGLVVFNSSPISVAPLSSDRDLAKAALKSAEARSVGFTSLARALSMGLDYFRDRPITATRLILLVSDGDAVIDGEDLEVLKAKFQRMHTQLMWIYVRGDREPSVMDEQTDSASLTMHKEFANMGMAYQLFEVTDPAGLQKAIVEIGRLTNKPTKYAYRLPRRDLGLPLYILAFLLIAGLIWVKKLEISAWHA